MYLSLAGVALIARFVCPLLPAASQFPMVSTENSKGQKKKLMWPSYSSSLEISDDIWEEESTDDETNITIIPSSASKNKRGAKHLENYHQNENQ